MVKKLALMLCYVWEVMDLGSNLGPLVKLSYVTSDFTTVFTRNCCKSASKSITMATFEILSYLPLPHYFML
jgi:hypothetical protein